MSPVREKVKGAVGDIERVGTTTAPQKKPTTSLIEGVDLGFEFDPTDFMGTTVRSQEAKYKEEPEITPAKRGEAKVMAETRAGGRPTKSLLGRKK